MNKKHFVILINTFLNMKKSNSYKTIKIIIKDNEIKIYTRKNFSENEIKITSKFEYFHPLNKNSLWIINNIYNKKFRRKYKKLYNKELEIELYKNLYNNTKKTYNFIIKNNKKLIDRIEKELYINE